MMPPAGPASVRLPGDRTDITLMAAKVWAGRIYRFFGAGDGDLVEQTLTEADACVSAEAEWGGASTVCETPCLRNQTHGTREPLTVL